MQSILKEINAVLGVTGSFICTTDGHVIAHEMPDSYTLPQLDTAAHTAVQAFDALDTSGQRAAEMDLTFGQGRLILKGLRGGLLGIVCSRHINLPLLNLTANVATKKITALFKSPKPIVPTPRPVVVTAPTEPGPAKSAETVDTTLVAAEGDPLFQELFQQAQHIIKEGNHYRVDLRVLESLAIYYSVTRSRSLLAPLGQRLLVFGGRSTQADAVELLFEQLGYKPNQRFNLLYGTRRLAFAKADCDLTAYVYLDAFMMYHRLDLTGFLIDEPFAIPETALLMTRLQMVEMSDACLRDICALLLEHDLSVGPEKEKIDASLATRICSEDWGWYKTVSINMDRLMNFASTVLSPADRPIVLERAQRLRQNIVSAPKGIRWQARARLGESARWYDTPLPWNAPTRPDMAMG